MRLGSEELAGLGTFERNPHSPCQAQKKVFPTSRTSWNLGWAFVRLAVCKWPFYDRTQQGSILTLSSPERTVSNVSVHILKSVLGWLLGEWEEGLSLGELERVKYCTNKSHRLILQVFCDDRWCIFAITIRINVKETKCKGSLWASSFLGKLLKVSKNQKWHLSMTCVLREIFMP